MWPRQRKDILRLHAIAMLNTAIIGVAFYGYNVAQYEINFRISSTIISILVMALLLCASSICSLTTDKKKVLAWKWHLLNIMIAMTLLIGLSGIYWALIPEEIIGRISHYAIVAGLYGNLAIVYIALLVACVRCSRKVETVSKVKA